MEHSRNQWSDLLFGVRRSIRYHNRRRMHFERFHTGTSAAAVILGSGAIVTLFSEWGTSMLPVILVAVVTVFSTIDLVVGTAKRARLHEDLSRRFTQVEKKMITSRVPTDEDWERLTQERLDIEAEEPPIKRVLDLMCHNELARAMGRPDKEMYHVRWYQRWLANLVDVRIHAIRSFGEEEAAHVGARHEQSACAKV